MVYMEIGYNEKNEKTLRMEINLVLTENDWDLVENKYPPVFRAAGGCACDYIRAL